MDTGSHSFIVRIWDESVEGGESVWRGSIEEVGGERKLYFSRLDGMVRFIQDQMGFKPPVKFAIWDLVLKRMKDVVQKLRN